MCTVFTYHPGGHYLGRTLDLDRGYGEAVVLTPRRYPLPFRRKAPLDRHPAILGMALVLEGYPLYFDAINEHGLAMAGLNFPKSAVYFPEEPGKDNITPFELIPWVLGQCRTVAEARPLLARLNLLDEAFRQDLPLSPLHWFLADRDEAVVLEQTAQGLQVYEDPVQVLTNEPPFPYQLHHLTQFRDLSPGPSAPRFSGGFVPEADCQGLAAVGLPGDWSSPSRFVRAAFVKDNSLCGDTAREQVNQVFRILDSVSMPRGCMRLADGGLDITRYAACCDLERGVYHFITYEDRSIRSVSLRDQDLEGSQVIAFPI